jgi:hypothetical protein
LDSGTVGFGFVDLEAVVLAATDFVSALAWPGLIEVDLACFGFALIGAATLAGAFTGGGVVATGPLAAGFNDVS